MEIRELVDLQREYYLTNATKSYQFRKEQLTKLYGAIKDNEKKLADALYQDFRKSGFETYMCETGIVYEEINYHLKHLKKWMKSKRVRTPLAQFPARSFLASEPYGVTLIMSPWNYPVQLCLNPLVGAISSGNTAIIKPSAYAINTSHAIKEIISSVFDEKYIAVVEGGREENKELLEQRFDFIFFTGSVAVGKTVMEKASRNLTPVILELGGKSPVIIDSGADLKTAARRVVFGKVLNCGQTCVEPDYVLCMKERQDEFIEYCIEALNEFFPEKDYSDMPVMVNEKHFSRVMGLINHDKVVYGGNGDEKSRFIEPTIMKDVNEDDAVMQEEIFGPLLPVIPIDSIDEAVDFIVRHEKPLALYLFTDSRETEEKVLSRCSFGGGCINDTIIHLATTEMGFGGVGYSGMGQYHGKKSYEAFSHYRSIVKKANWLDLPMRYHPYDESKLGLIKRFMK